MVGLAWKVRRLRAMSLRELLWRIKVAAETALETWRYRRGWEALPVEEVGCATPLLERFDDWEILWHTHFSLDKESLDALLSGRIELFGATLEVGESIDWLRDPLTGITASTGYGKTLDYRDESQFGNIKFLWELGRHQHLTALATAYAVSGDERYRDAVLRQIESWINQNPFCSGIHWCSSLELSLRLISWSFCNAVLSLRLGSNGLFKLAEHPEKLGRSIYQQCRFVRGFHSRHSSANNHLIGELTGVYLACSTFDLGTEGERWRKEAAQELIHEAGVQVYGDGVSREQSTYYHLWVLEYLLLASAVGARREDPIARQLTPIILKMREFLDDMTPAGGIPPAIGDADDGAVVRFDPGLPEDPYEDVLAAVDAIHGPGRHFRACSHKSFWYSWLANGRPHVQERMPDRHFGPIGAYPEAGYGVARAGVTHVVFDAGPLGFGSLAAHGHADALSICLAVGGGWWLCDPGTYCYHDQPRWRDYFRGTAAHNTIRIDGQDQGEIGGPFLWSRQYHAHIEEAVVEATGCRLSGAHYGYGRLGCTHRRELRLSPRGDVLRIYDTVEGDGLHELELFLHMMPTVKCNLLPDGLVAMQQDDEPYELWVRPPKGWDTSILSGYEEPIAGWYSDRLDVKVPAPVLVARYSGRVPVKFVTNIEIRTIATLLKKGDYTNGGNP